MRVGLVPGAGGVLGGAWLVGALRALASETGWNPGSAEYVVGTSAGGTIAGLSASGVPPWFMVAHSRQVRLPRPSTTSRRNWPRPAGRPARCFGCIRARRARTRLVAAGARLACPTVPLLAGGDPRRLASRGADVLRAAEGDYAPRRRYGWPPHPNLWIMACDHDTGRRVAFGRADAPPAPLADSVAASRAIPGFYRPVEICGRRYVDAALRPHRTSTCWPARRLTS